jgi:hypothetical protein
MALDKNKAEQLWNDGLTDSQIAKELMCKTKDVTNWRKYYELPSNFGIFSWKKADKNGICNIEQQAL